MKKCELCKFPARLHCESDQANLCAECDLKVHEANFLVARHSRRLLCLTCQAPTPWEASGARLGNTVTECDACVEGGRGGSEGVVVHDEVFADDDNYFDGSRAECEGGDEEEMEEEEEDESQVMPWSPTPPPAASSSSSDETS
uniref:B box-type domain-containing protein n=1 Tax=Kalanchoe fedtschenkoi TaxID=63787 RepID=A0A7N0TKU9_KALFE